MYLDKVIALDVGDARIGVAISDALRITAQPLLTIRHSNGSAAEQLLAIFREQKVSTVVVGIPLLLNGVVGEQAKKVMQFVDTLRKACEQSSYAITFLYWDERLSTVAAERVIQGTKLRDSERRASLDRVSAALILSAYLESAPGTAGWTPPTGSSTAPTP